MLNGPKELSLISAVLLLAASTVNYADSTNVLPRTTTDPQQRVVQTITTTYAAPLFATNPNQTIYSSTNLDSAGACPSTSVQAPALIPSNYFVSVKYYASHFHYECGNVAGPASCTSTTGHDPTVSIFSGQSLSQPASTCGIQTISSASCSKSDASCTYKVCSVSSGTWHAFYEYQPDASGSFNGAHLCIQHGWVKAPIN